MSRMHRAGISGIAAALLVGVATIGHAQEAVPADRFDGYTEQGADPSPHMQSGTRAPHVSLFSRRPVDAADAEQRNRDVVRSVTGLPGGSNGGEGR